MLKVRAHTCYLGKTGYAYHARSFFRELSKYVDLRVRNFTWDVDLEYLNDVDIKILDSISLSDNNGLHKEYPMIYSFPDIDWKYKSIDSNFIPDVDIVLMDANNLYFYDEYNSKIKIAYTVWESTEIDNDFFQKLLEFDYLWVVSEWHKKIIVNQGYPIHKVLVVNEGVDSDIYLKEINDISHLPEFNNDKFNFILFGRWDYRKAIPEILQTFLQTFKDNNDVNFILCADNSFAKDGLSSTEERLLKYNLIDDKIIIKHFLSREDYITYLRKANVLVSCSRSEGWNIPLIEGLAAGTPVIYSNYGAQLEFANGLGTPVNYIDKLPASIGYEKGISTYSPGLYCEPDFKDLSVKMKECYDDYTSKKAKANKDAIIIRNKFNWEEVGKRGYELLSLTYPIELPEINKKEAIIILSHADTDKKIDILKESILSVRRQGYFTILSTHIDVPNFIKDIVDILLIDKDNPIIDKKEYEIYDSLIYFFINRDSYELQRPLEYNHGFAALRLIQNGINFLRNRKIDKVHIINYDYIIRDPNTIKMHNLLLEDNDIVCYKWRGSELSMNTGFFSMNLKNTFDDLNNILTKKDFIEYKDKFTLEDIILDMIKEKKRKIKFLDISSMSNINEKNILATRLFDYLSDIYGDNCFFNVCRIISEKGNGDLIFVATNENDIKISFSIKYNGDEYQYNINGFESIFIKINNVILNNSFEVFVHKFNEAFNYDKNSTIANIKFNNDDIDIIEFIPDKTEYLYNSNFVEGAFIEILKKNKTKSNDLFDIKFIDDKNNSLLYESKINSNMWTKFGIQYYLDLRINVYNKENELLYTDKLDLFNKNVLISIESASLGDTLAWVPYIDEFRKKHNCKIYLSTFYNFLFKNKYDNIEFIDIGSIVNNISAQYHIGWYYDQEDKPNYMLHPADFRKYPMQKTSADILGVEYTGAIKPKLIDIDQERKIEGDYVCLGIHSTTKAKYWNNPTGWQEITNYFLSKNKKVIILSNEENGYMNIFNPCGVTNIPSNRSLEETMSYLKYCDMFIGVGSGLSWLSWAMNKPTVIISGFSLPYTEILDNNVIRIFNNNVCNGCFNKERLDPSDWNWCPYKKGTDQQYECSAKITANDVIKDIENFYRENNNINDIYGIIDSGFKNGMIQDYNEILSFSTFFKELNVKNFMEIGTDLGGTFIILSKLSKINGIKISLDLPHSTFGNYNYDINLRNKKLQSLEKNIKIVEGDSHEKSTKEKIQKILGDNLLDFLFIDGDHTYEGVKKDYIMYKDFVKPGGWIGFHDIKDTEFHREQNCYVYTFWNELEGEKIEYINNESNFGGIGLIRKL